MIPLLPLFLIILPLVLAETTTPNTGDQLQSFTFGYSTSNLVLPIIPTCPTPLTLTQLTTTNSGGPDPVAPYTLLLFTHEQLQDGAGIRYERTYAKRLSVGNMDKVLEVPHPWGNGTQFVGCVWASNGVSGGCQDLTTVVPSYTDTAIAYANATSACRTTDVMGSWVTPDAQTLDVDVEGNKGTVSENSWPAACSDLKFTPKNGTGPYTLVIAPAAHPPVNITSASSGDTSMNYTVRLTHGQAFMAGVFDSAGNSFVIGPLHSGESTKLRCLAVSTGHKGSRVFSPGIGGFAGGIAGAFVVGALGAGLIMFFLGRKKQRGAKRSESQELLNDPYADPRPLSFREGSGSSLYPKYSDQSPPIGYDTPYYTSPNPNANEIRPFPRPPSEQFGVATDDFRPRGFSVGSSTYPQPTTPQLGIRSSTTGGGAGGEHRVRGKGGRLHSVGGAASPARERERERDSRGDWDERSDDDEEGVRRRNVYVVHSDGGGGDVHIRLPERGARVVELPPTYQPDPVPSLGNQDEDQNTNEALTNPVPNRNSQPLPPLPLPTLPHPLPNTHTNLPYPSLRNSIPNPYPNPNPNSHLNPNLNPNPNQTQSPLPSLLGHELVHSPSRESGRTDVTLSEAEIKARAEAAMREKGRSLG